MNPAAEYSKTTGRRKREKNDSELRNVSDEDADFEEDFRQLVGVISKWCRNALKIFN